MGKNIVESNMHYQSIIFCFTLFQCVFGVIFNTNDYTWIDFEDGIPPCAVQVAADRAGNPRYVAVYEHHKTGYITKIGNDYILSNFYKPHLNLANNKMKIPILCVSDTNNLKWLPTSPSDMLFALRDHLIVGGDTFPDPLFIGMVTVQNETVIGFIDVYGDQPGIYFAHNNVSDVRYSDYQVLSYKKSC